MSCKNSVCFITAMRQIKKSFVILCDSRAKTCLSVVDNTLRINMQSSNFINAAATVSRVRHNKEPNFSVIFRIHLLKFALKSTHDLSWFLQQFIWELSQKRKSWALSIPNTLKWIKANSNSEEFLVTCKAILVKLLLIMNSTVRLISYLDSNSISIWLISESWVA